MNGFNKPQNVTCTPDNVSLGVPSKMSNGHKDFNNQLSNNSSCSSSTPFGGARPKTREFVDDVPNGLQTQSSPSNSPSSRWSLNDISSVGFCGNLNNLSDDLPKDNAQVQGLECVPGPSQTRVERQNESCESDASCLAAVCAASSRRAIAERARLAEHGMIKRLCNPVDSDSSSDTGNDDALSGDECCIYTYKGDQNADLANGLLGLSLPLINELIAPPHPVDNVNRDGASSPEMDFLEMDFDPDPLGEQDSVEEDIVHIETLNRSDRASSSPSPSGDEVSNDISAPPISPENSSSEEEGAGAVVESIDESDSDEVQNVEPNPFVGINVGASTSADNMKNLAAPNFPPGISKEILRSQHIAGSQLCPVDIDNTHKISFVSTVRTWNSNNEPVLDKQKFNLYSALYHSIMANNLILDEENDDLVHDDVNSRDIDRKENTGDVAGNVGEGCLQKRLCQGIGKEVSDLEKTMIWTEKEACHKQVSQIAVSACGAAAVSNVLCALNVPFSLEQVHEGVATRLRAEKANLPTYLFSRSAAGSAHTDLIRGLELASEGTIYSRFFHMYPERSFCLSRWLAHWIKEGAVPIATLNIQKSAPHGATIPDSWHHQMVFGVSHRGIYLTNPLECVNEEVLHPQLCSPSELLIRRQDIVSRWCTDTDLCRLATSSDIRWKQMNVLGQVVNVLRENFANPSLHFFRRNLTSHISIPASYCSGILLSVKRESSAASHLENAPELPLKIMR